MLILEDGRKFVNVNQYITPGGGKKSSVVQGDLKNFTLEKKLTNEKSIL